MVWSSLVGSFLGSIIAAIVITAAIVIFVYFDDKKKAAAQEKAAKLARPLFNDVLENHLEAYIVEHFSELFPGWKIYDVRSSDTANGSSRPVGVRYRTEAGEIDILCTDERDNFVILELKRDKAPDRVIHQVDRYMTWVRRNLAKPDQQVRAIIMARSFNSHLSHSIARREEVDLMAYNWRLSFDLVKAERV